MRVIEVIGSSKGRTTGLINKERRHVTHNSKSPSQTTSKLASLNPIWFLANNWVRQNWLKVVYLHSLKALFGISTETLLNRSNRIDNTSIYWSTLTRNISQSFPLAYRRFFLQFRVSPLDWKPSRSSIYPNSICISKSVLAKPIRTPCQSFIFTGPCSCIVF